MSTKRLTGVDRRKQILEMAAEVFATYGYDGARTKDIAKACGINEAVIYRHFHGKDDLFLQFITHNYKIADSKWKELAASAPNGLAALKAVIFAQIEALTTHDGIKGAMIQGVAASQKNENLKTAIRGFFTEYHNFLADLIRKGIKDGSIKDVEPESLAWTLRSIVWAHLVFDLVDLRKRVKTTSSMEVVIQIFEFLDNRKKSGGRDGSPK